MTDLLGRGKISTGKACELLGRVDQVAFARCAAELDTPYQMIKEDWEAEKATATPARPPPGASTRR